MKPILLFGRNGQIAWELRRTLAPLGQIIALDRHSQPVVDLSRTDTLIQSIRAFQPRWIINAAAYTAVDRAEQEPELAHQVNAVAPGIMAEEGKKIGASLVHFSTDYVFSGEAAVPYREENPTAPQSVYGKSKLAGEQAILASGCDHLILRTAWVYGSRGRNFLLTMLRLMSERKQLGVVDDQVGSPTWCRLIAEACSQILAQQPTGLNDKAGIYHLTASGQTSWHGFAAAIREFGQQQGILTGEIAQIQPIKTEQYPTPAKRPAFSVLANQKLARTFGLRLPDWRDSLQLCVEGLAAGQP